MPDPGDALTPADPNDLAAALAFALRFSAQHKVATPANWKHGDDVIIAGSVTDDDAKKLFPDGWKAPKPYLRIVKQPG